MLKILPSRFMKHCIHSQKKSTFKTLFTAWSVYKWYQVLVYFLQGMKILVVLGSIFKMQKKKDAYIVQISFIDTIQPFHIVIPGLLDDTAKNIEHE